MHNGLVPLAHINSRQFYLTIVDTTVKDRFLPDAYVSSLLNVLQIICEK